MPDALSDKAFSVVGIGAAAGGTEACAMLLGALDPDTALAVVVIQHWEQQEGAEALGSLSQILSQRTALSVQEATHKQVVQPGHVYVVPPNVQVTIADERLQIEPSQLAYASAKAIDIFMTSLAASCGSRAVGVVLYGSGEDGLNEDGLDGDGACGLELVKQAGGITFAQSRGAAQLSEMPNMAIETGFVDFILPPAEIARKITDLVTHLYAQPDLAQPAQPQIVGEVIATSYQSAIEAVSEADLSTIHTLLQASTAIDFSQYKRMPFVRRMQRRMALYRLSEVTQYAELLTQQPAELKALYRDLLISVTSFFRDPEAFESLKQTVFPSLVDPQEPDPTIRIWVAGCSTGQECYSLAIALFEYFSTQTISPTVQIFGTDINEDVINVARKGLYTASQMSGVSAARQRRFFTEVKGRYQVSQAIRESCIFARQSLSSDAPFSNIDFISCRNVLIYFTLALQKRVLAVFHYSLNASGFLWLGSSESVGETSELFESVDKNHKTYRRSAAINRLSFDFISSDKAPPHTSRTIEAAVPSTSSYSNVQRQADQLVLSRYAPVGVVVNERLDILHFRGNTSAYLRHASGEPSFSLLKMLQPGLLLEVRSAVNRVKKQGVSARKENLKLEGRSHFIHLEVTPIKSPLSQERSYIVLFEEGPPIEATVADERDRFELGPSAASHPDVIRLERELAATRRDLLDTQTYWQVTIEEHDAVNQRLTAANEEILSSNEELQSTNEELQTAKEEIQAANEELKTTNEELQNRNTDARTTNDDLLNLLNNVNLPIVMLSNDLRIRRFTPTAQRLFNLIPADIGRPISDIRIDIDVPDLELLISQVIATLDAQQHEVRDSAGRWYRLRIRPYRTADNQIDGAVMALVDIDDIRQTLQQLEVSRLYAESIVETVREPLVVLNRQLEVKTANRAFYEFLQSSVTETEGRLLFDVGGGQWNIPILRGALESLLAGSVQIQDVEVEHNFEKIGRKTLLLNAREIARQDEQPDDARMILLAIEDITKRKRAEQARLQLVQERAARVEAESANASKDEFLSVLSHELRTPLNAILGWTEVLLGPSESDDSTRERALTSIARSAHTQTRIIEDLLEVSRITQGQLMLQRRAVNLTALVNNTAENMLPVAARAGIQITVDLEEAPDYFYFDHERLQQVFNNALSNSIKFTPSAGQIEVRLSYLGDRAQIQIIDTGMGIAAEFLPYVFDRFRQADSSNSRQYGGLGLGLAIIKFFVEAHEGSVQINSLGTGAGTTLTITLPLIAALPPAAERAPRLDGNNLLSGLRILVVEDDLENLDIVRVTLEAQQATVLTAASVDEAIALMSAAKMPDLLISDISLPGKDGFVLIDWVRSHPAEDGHEMPVIALTGYAAIADTENLLSAGFQYHLVKPTRMDELIAAAVSLV